MTKTKSLKKAFIASCLSLVMCLSMLVGTTFAWFTDSVTNNVNQIVSGNLDVELWHCAQKDADPNIGFGYYDANGTQVDGTTKLFLDENGKDMLWQPGATTGETFRVKNAGSLPLKFKFSLKAVDVVKTPTGKSLTEALSMQVVELHNNDNGIPMGPILYQGAYDSNYVVEDELQAGEVVDYFVSIDWYQSANDNEFNVPGGLKVDLGICLVATQLNDKAVYPWNGIVPTEAPAGFVVTPTADERVVTIDINSVEAFAYLNNYDYASYLKEVSPTSDVASWAANNVVNLNCDIDLNNMPWTPIDASQKFGTFNGNGHEVKNVYVNSTNANVGLFHSVATVKDLTVKNANIVTTGNNAGVVSGRALTTAENVNVLNSSVTGAKYVGAIVGYSGGGAIDATITGSKVENTKVTASTSKEAGAIVGFASINNGFTYSITNNKVLSCEVSAPTVASAIISQTGTGAYNLTVTGNEIENTTISTKDDTASLIISSVNNTGTNTIENNTDTNNTYVTNTEVSSLEKAFAGVNFGYGSTNSAPVVLDGKGVQKITEWTDAWYTNDVTIKGVTFLNGATFSAEGTGITATITLEDCTFYACDQQKLIDAGVGRLDNSGAGLCLDIETGDNAGITVVIKNCTFIGEGDENIERNGYKNWADYNNGTKSKARGYGIAINGVAGNGTAESVLIDGCTFTGIRDNAIQLYSFDYEITVQNCVINGWGYNVADTAGTHTGAAIRGDIDTGSAGSLVLNNNYYGETETSTSYHVKVDNYAGNTDGTRVAGTY